MKQKSFAIICLFFLCISAKAGPLEDIWGELIQKYPPPKPTQKERQTFTDLYDSMILNYPASLFDGQIIDYDDVSQMAWPFLKTHHISKNKKAFYQSRLKPFQAHIEKASFFFDVPEEIIGGVILQESSGNPRAKAKTSSAKGLMQTIDATFEFARKNLLKHEFIISDPYNPLHSILAGTWYLSYVFELSKEDWPIHNDRSQLAMWEKALEYYYAGPVWGKNPKPIFHAYTNGKRIVIQKAYYSRKVLEYAFML
jgi:soluble lytic murein transglycosylase-like protein